MRVLKALRILEAAAVECKTRAIETADVREALDLLAPLQVVIVGRPSADALILAAGIETPKST